MLLLLSPPAKSTPRPKRARSAASRHIDHRIGPAEATEFILSGTIDAFGNTTSKYFKATSGPIGLSEEHFSVAQEFAETLSSRPELRAFVSPRYIIDVLFDWFHARYEGLSDAQAKFTDKLIDQIAVDVKLTRVAVPLSFMEIDESFTIGPIEFAFFDQSFFDGLLQQYRIKHPDLAPESVDALRKKYQGEVFAVVTVEAEPRRATIHAAEMTEQALTVLRLYAPTVYLPQVPSYFGRKGHVQIPSSHFFVFEAELPTIVSEIDSAVIHNFTVDSTLLELMRQGGLNHFDVLLRQTRFSEFEERLLTALSIFGKGVLSTELHDKLVFILASLETLLLKDSGEPIQMSMGQRLAFVVERSPQRRKALIGLLKEGYQLRSSYLHHGQLHKDLQTVANLSMIAAAAFRRLVTECNKYKSHAEFIDDLELRILT